MTSARPKRFPRAACGALALGAAGVAAALGLVPTALTAVYVVLSCVSYLMYYFDKTAAARQDQRTPENLLHLADLVGGWPGALIAQQQFRHKTIKQPFQAIFWITVAANLVGAWWFVSSGHSFGNGPA